MNNKGRIALIVCLVLAGFLALNFATGARQCNDSQDNDGDGLVDYPDDSGCQNRGDGDENNCGNNIIDGTEVCDGTDLGGETCSSQGFSGGTLACASSCGAFDTSGCFTTTACNDGIDNDGDGDIDSNDVGCSNLTDNDETNCGDGVISGSEVCDGSNLNNETCSSKGFDGGTLGCESTCDAFDTSGCFTNSCSDSDGGVVYTTQGTVSGSNNGQSFSHTDACGTGGNSSILTEWFCAFTTTPSSTNFDCSLNYTGCSNGACQ